MSDFTILGREQFPDDEMVAFVWPADKAETPIRAVVNGRAFSIAPNTAYLTAAPIFEVVRNSGYRVRRISAAPTQQDSPPAEQEDDGEGADGSAGGGQSVGATFDPDAVIVGPIPEVTKRLAALTPEQLEAVREAEIDRELPRKGVIEAIDAIGKAAPAA